MLLSAYNKLNRSMFWLKTEMQSSYGGQCFCFYWHFLVNHWTICPVLEDNYYEWSIDKNSLTHSSSKPVEISESGAIGILHPSASENHSWSVKQFSLTAIRNDTLMWNQSPGTPVTKWQTDFKKRFMGTQIGSKRGPMSSRP